jgi:hypothetical protein
MASSELQESWRRTEAYLRDARAHLSEAEDAIYADEIHELEGFLEHNELGLAFDVLDAVATQSALVTPRVLELLALAAASMGLLERQRALDARLTKLRGWRYETRLPVE